MSCPLSLNGSVKATGEFGPNKKQLYYLSRRSVGKWEKLPIFNFNQTPL